MTTVHIRYHIAAPYYFLHLCDNHNPTNQGHVSTTASKKFQLCSRVTYNSRLFSLPLRFVTCTFFPRRHRPIVMQICHQVRMARRTLQENGLAGLYGVVTVRWLPMFYSMLYIVMALFVWGRWYVLCFWFAHKMPTRLVHSVRQPQPRQSSTRGSPLSSERFF